MVLPRTNPRKLTLLLLAGVAALAGCGVGGGGSPQESKRIRGSGYSFEVPADWQVKRAVRVVSAQKGPGVVSVTAFRLAKPYRAAIWDSMIVPELDRQIEKLAAAEQGKLAKKEDTTVAGRKARVYEIDRSGNSDERLVYLFQGRREYQLFCRAAGDACDMLLDTFTVG